MNRRFLLAWIAVAAAVIAPACGGGSPSSPSGSGGVAVQGVVLGDGTSFAASSGAKPVERQGPEDHGDGRGHLHHRRGVGERHLRAEGHPERELHARLPRRRRRDRRGRDQRPGRLRGEARRPGQELRARGRRDQGGDRGDHRQPQPHLVRVLGQRRHGGPGHRARRRRHRGHVRRVQDGRQRPRRHPHRRERLVRQLPVHRGRQGADGRGVQGLDQDPAPRST